ncbi:ABC-2 type transport system ATP-binding protein [Kitasatospora gansuensis]|uniref:ABC-2 type transport system ATP-binding protein n=1 Tax=Kitasatospora gansuensis TaxID=258050 RepID=A0A7W7SDW0_9ACTN|nr:ABC transporter ATP-binding protein [Kitasatospora gansuensis]MBB4948277.1 ABC-2 type transport system ATP-binding protein [Kitasatospora gansuensis]
MTIDLVAPEGVDVTSGAADVLTAEGLVKKFGDRSVVDGISLRVGKGEILGFLGPNGAGKSTTIAMLTGALAPDEGSISVGGLGLTADPIRAKALIGVVPQEIALYPSLTARQNLAFFAGAYKLPRRLRDERIDWALDVVGLTDRAGDRVSSFSGGMQRRVNIAAALLHKPKLLFLDEPTVGVDAQSRNQIFETVLRLRAEFGMSVVYTSHYMPEVEQLCDRIVIIDDGRVLAEGTQDELLEPLGEGLLEWSLNEAESALLPKGVEDLAVAFTAHGEVTVTAATLRVRVTDMPATLRRVSDLATEHGLGLGGIKLGRPDLESLFLDLTGRQIRDGA